MASKRRPRYVHDSETHNRRAARRVVPWIMERLSPGTVIDVGCGLGTWAAVFREHGCEVLGLDGDCVPIDLLDIPRDRFREVDLEGEISPPGRFDLAVCLEVAEHLAEDAAPRLIDLLTSASDTILFSAAVPGQGGDNHVNERWPAYWQALFRQRGFGFEDDVRWAFWDDEDVDWWYRQNMFLVRRGADPATGAPPVVHPGLLAKKVRAVEDFYSGRIPLRTAVIVLARSLARTFRRG